MQIIANEMSKNFNEKNSQKNLQNLQMKNSNIYAIVAFILYIKKDDVGFPNAWRGCAQIFRIN
jgi:hypothetical protein